MKFRHLIMGFIIPAILIALPCLADPGLALSEDLFDFGIVPQHARVSHTFWLKSTGDDTLQIIKVIPGCGCTKTPLQTDIIAPGDSTRLEIIFDTGKYRGKVTKRPRVRTNEANPDHVVTIKSQVETRPDSTYPLIVTPYKIDLTQFGDKKRKKAEFSLTNVSDKDLLVTLVSDPKDIARIKLPKNIKAGQSARGEIELTDEGLAIPFEKSFTFEAKSTYTHRFSVPVKRDVVILPEGE